MKKLIAAAVAVSAVFLIAGCEVPEEDNKPGKQRATTSAQGKDKGKAEGKEKADAPKETVNQANARASAENYLSVGPFSRAGLIKQLKFEGFSQKDAVYGADAVGADWNEQAVKSAKNYLDMTAFSRAGLIEQLEFEGFTREQAEYGVNKTGLK